MAGFKSGGSVRVSQVRSPLAGVSHFAEKPIRQPDIKIPKVSAPHVAAPKGPAVTMPKFTAAGGLGQPSYGKAGPIAMNRPPHTKQVNPRIIPMRRDIVPAQRPIGMTSQDEGSGGLQ